MPFSFVCISLSSSAFSSQMPLPTLNQAGPILKKLFHSVGYYNQEKHHLEDFEKFCLEQSKPGLLLHDGKRKQST